MLKLKQLNKKYPKLITWGLRIVIGSTFIISGLSKIIDVWGFVYKIEQYLAVWEMEITRPLITITAMTLSAIEFVVGILLATGCYRRCATWFATLIMSIMLPFSLYLTIANPVDNCGCFGDFWVLSNFSTFIKNIIITLCLIYLCKYNKFTPSLFNNKTHWLVFCLSYIYIIFIGFIGYNVQPLIDFRQYKEGTPITNRDNSQNNFSYEFIYEKDGNRQQFNIENLPDSTWTYIDRIDLNENNIQSNNIVIYDMNDNNVTDELFLNSGEQIILLIPELKYADISYSYLMNEMYNYITAIGGNMIGIFAHNDKKKIERWTDISLAQWPKYVADDTIIKELARGKISVVYLKNGIIQWKRALSSIPSNIFSNNNDKNILNNLYIYGHTQFIIITTIFISLLLGILFFNWFWEIVKSKFYRKNKKKNVTLQKNNIE